MDGDGDDGEAFVRKRHVDAELRVRRDHDAEDGIGDEPLTRSQLQVVVMMDGDVGGGG